MTRRAQLTAVALLVASACSGSPAAPRRVVISSPAAAGPVVSAPTIGDVTVAVARTEVDTNVKVSAAVTFPLDNPAAFDHAWTTNVGTIAGNGTAAVWRLVKGTTVTPAHPTVTLTLRASESEKDGPSQPVGPDIVSQTSAPFRVHDSIAEISAMTMKFLNNFATSSVSPDVCVEDFSNICAADKAEELEQIQDNREMYVIKSSVISVSSVKPNAGFTFATIVAPCEFVSTIKATGLPEHVKGNCNLTAVYDQTRWRLCESLFDGKPLPASSHFFGRRR